VVITLLLEKFGRIPPGLDVSPAPVMVTVFDETGLLESYALAAELRQAGIKVGCYPAPAKLGKQFKYADRIGARLAVIIGPDELSQGQVAVKDLKSRGQRTLPRSEAAETIRKMLAGDDSP
jgi:histidyl-tRNA synthetase